MKSRPGLWRLAAVSALLFPIIAACSRPAAPTPTIVPPTAAPSASPAPSPFAGVIRGLAGAPAGPVKRTARAAAFHQDDRGRPEGALTPFSVTVQAGPRDQDFRLGFFETNVGQLGPMWRSSAWMATLVAALETGKDISSHRVSWETEGLVDGPSASGLMTVAMVAALRGDELKGDVGFTGTINPDGSIGPVSGIIYKVDAAARGGMKSFLIPIGQRSDTDLESKQTVDVVQRGQGLGVTVQEVATLDEAYEMLTGKKLPRTPLPSRPPELSAEAYDRLKPKVAEWLTEYQDAAGRFKTASSQARELFAEMPTEADVIAKRAQKYLDEGSVVEAWSAAEDAALFANMAADAARLFDTLSPRIQAGGDLRGAGDVVTQVAGSSRVQSLVERLKANVPTTTDDAMQCVTAWSVALLAVAIEARVDHDLQALREASSLKEQGGHLGSAVAYRSTTRLIPKLADDLLGFTFGRGRATPQKVDPAALESWAGVFRRAAEANLNYFESLVLDPVAKKYGVHPDTLKAAFAAKSLDYAKASFGASPAAIEYLERTLGKTPALSYAQLGFAVSSYLSSSGLVAEFYSLDAQLDESGNVTGFGRERALASMLDAASDRAREQIAALESAGGDASMAVVSFKAARSQREGASGASVRLEALKSYWEASNSARLMVLIAEPKSSPAP